MYFLIPFRFARILALDYEALVINLQRAHQGALDFLPWGRFLLLYAAAPLFILFFAGWLYRMLARRGRLENPLLDMSPARRFGLGLAAFAPFAAFCVPLGHALSVWTSVEAFWWIQWYDNIAPAMNWIRVQGPPFFLPGALAGGLVLIRFAMPKTGGASLVIRTARILIGIVFLLALAPVFAVSILHGTRLAVAPGLSVFAKNCGECHTRSRPLYFIKTPVEWRRTVTRMKEREEVPISEDEKEDVIAFLSGMRSFSDRWTFRTRCQRCHVTDSRHRRERRPEDWEAIAERIARHSPYYYRPDVRDQLVGYLAESRSSPGTTLGLPPADYERYRDFGRVCSACHSLSRQAEKYGDAEADQITELVRRMGRKMPKSFSAEEIADLAGTYRQIVPDTPLFDMLFPHDRPVLQGGLPW